MRHRFTILLAFALLLCCSSCAFLRAAGAAMAGAGTGFAVGGPPGAVLGAGAGAVAGDEWNARLRLEEENEGLRSDLAAARENSAANTRELVDLRRRVDALPNVTPATTLPFVYGPELPPPAPKDERTFWEKSPITLLWERIRGGSK